MKVVNVGNEFNIYDNFVETFDRLPTDVYYLRFAKMKGFFFERRDLNIKEKKIYGDLPDKVDKVFNTYDSIERNLGVLISGDKGMGKSLFAKLLCDRAIQNDYPVIIIDYPYNGIPEILEKLEQKCLILFDEFEKVFIEDDNDSNVVTQNSLLTLFDGINNGKKLFVITCNNLDNLSEYIISRPGRFHYHFRFDYPTIDEIETYLKENVREEFYDEIESVKRFSTLTKINYDCLRSIAFELNFGYSFSDAIKDLNIINYGDAYNYYNIILKFKEGDKVESLRSHIDIFTGSKKERVHLSDKKGRHIGAVEFYSKDITYDDSIGAYIVKSADISFEPDQYDDYGKEEEYYRNLTPESLIIRNFVQTKINFNL